MSLGRVVRRALSILWCVAGIALAFAASCFASYETARFTSHVGALFCSALAICFLLTLATKSLTLRLWGAATGRVPLRFSASVTAIFAAAIFLAVLRGTHYPHITPIIRANTQFWSLPSGSHIAYSVYEPLSGIPVRPDPIVFLHGGPGFKTTDADHAFYQQFSSDGFRVYLFDQAGSGLSDRLPHAAEYTVERFVTDLEQIRRQIGVNRMVLIGHSWGGILAAHYAAAYPSHVGKLVLHSPGELWIESTVTFERQRTAADTTRPLPPPRILAAFALSNVNPAVAENLVPQSELGDWEQATGDGRELVCKAVSDRLPAGFNEQTTAGMNMYPILVSIRELQQKKMDVRPQLRALHLPAIALEGECDFIPWSLHSVYRKTIPGLREFYFPGAGHSIDLSYPAKLAAVMRSFLLDQPPPFPAYTGDADPRPPIPK